MMIRKVLAMYALFAVPASAQTTLETISIWDAANSVSPFGKANTATYGQTFTVPTTDNVLQSFSFFLTDAGAGSNLLFQGYVSGWDPLTSVLTGPILFQSSIRSGPAAGAGFTRYDFDVGGVPLVTGDTYMLFLSSSGLFANIPGASALASVGSLPTNVDSGIGMFHFNNSGDLFGNLSTVGWSAFNQDLAFEVVLGETEPSVVPEPSTVLLVGTGMGILLLGVTRRRRRT